MRTSSLFSELVVYIPAIVIFCKVYGQLRGRTDSQASIGVSAILLQPGLMIIDHGHFQCVTRSMIYSSAVAHLTSFQIQFLDVWIFISCARLLHH